MQVRLYRPDDRAEWLRMQRLLWPDAGTPEEQAAGADALLARQDAVVLVLERPAGGLCGFAEVGERTYADGCESSPVGFLEAWFVEEDVRGRQLGKALVDAALDWCRVRGLSELASDALLEDVSAHAAHERAGFEEVERSVKYRQQIRPLAEALSKQD